MSVPLAALHFLVHRTNPLLRDAPFHARVYQAQIAHSASLLPCVPKDPEGPNPWPMIVYAKVLRSVDVPFPRYSVLSSPKIIVELVKFSFIDKLSEAVLSGSCF